MLGWKHEIKVLLLNQHLWLWAPGISKIIVSPENPHQLQQTTRESSVVFRHLPSPDSSHVCLLLPWHGLPWVFLCNRWCNLRQNPCRLLQPRCMWKKTLKWEKSMAIICYIYISLAYYVYCTLFWCVYKKKSCHSPVHPKEKKNPLLKGGTIDHPLRKRVVPPEPIEATDMTVMRDNKEWKTKEDVVLKKDWKFGKWTFLSNMEMLGWTIWVLLGSMSYAFFLMSETMFLTIWNETVLTTCNLVLPGGWRLLASAGLWSD